MSSNNRPLHFFKSIRFKLTLLYSLILFLFSTILVVSLNMYLNSYLTSDPSIRRPPPVIQGLDENGDPWWMISFNQLQEAERNRIREIRLQDLRQIQTLSLIALFPIAVISFVLGYIISGKFLNPINELKLQFRNIRTKDLGKTIPVNADDEVGLLIESFNDLSLRLKSSFTTQEQFVQDASHELKTPLTVIQTNLDTVVDDPKASNRELQQAIHNALDGMKHVRKLTENLLQLTATESVIREGIDLNELLGQLTDNLKPLAAQKKVKLEFSPSKEPVRIMGDEMSLARAVSNIIENGIKYSSGANAALVKAELIKEKEQAVINIADNGPGIPPEHQARIFDRFYRVDKSRSRMSGGFGLGLPIAKKIVREHRGNIELQSTPGKTVFSITLPLLRS